MPNHAVERTAWSWGVARGWCRHRDFCFAERLSTFGRQSLTLDTFAEIAPPLPMGFLSNLFKKGEEPAMQYLDDVLGSMQWSEDDESWCGEFDGARFAVTYDGAASPSETLISYAREVLADRRWLDTSLADAKEQARQTYGDFYTTEINSLTFGRIDFYTHKGGRRIIADLDGGRDDRLWRIEYADRHCEGIGFDR